MDLNVHLKLNAFRSRAACWAWFLACPAQNHLGKARGLQDYRPRIGSVGSESVAIVGLRSFRPKGEGTSSKVTARAPVAPF